jgi:uncharacterized protein YjeT (DUF2065 family)
MNTIEPQIAMALVVAIDAMGRPRCPRCAKGVACATVKLPRRQYRYEHCAICDRDAPYIKYETVWVEVKR